MSPSNDLLILGAEDVTAALTGRQHDVLKRVEQAYEAHTRGDSSLPHSGFLRFPDEPRDRIISLPGFLGGDFGVAGVKWIASMPGNIERGIERASAVVVLNERVTGRPYAVMEGSIISKQRTAASAAMASKVLRGDRAPASIGFVGCGPINREVAHFLDAVWPSVGKRAIFDLSPERAGQFREHLLAANPGTEVTVVDSLDTLLRTSDLTAFATTAGVPHLDSLDACAPGSTVLHVSLRDIAAGGILQQPRIVNVVDDFDHVNRAQTSIHLAYEETGNDDFVLGSIGEVLLGEVALPPLEDKVAVFSPFGLGVLDLAVAQLVTEVSAEQGRGVTVPSFLPV